MPLYTADLTQGKTYARSSILSGSYEVFKAFDNNPSTFWHSDAQWNSWVSVDFGSPVKIAKVILKTAVPQQTTAELQGSDDNSTWTNVYTMTGMNAENTYTFEFANAIAYRYYRAVGTAYYYFGLFTFQMFAAINYKSSGTYLALPIDAETITDDSAINWESTEPTGTSVVVAYAFNESNLVPPETWESATNGEAMNFPASLTGKYLWILATLATTDPGVTPKLSAMTVNGTIVDPKKIQVNLTYDGRIRYPQGDIIIVFNGSMFGPGNVAVAPFSQSFTPVGIVPWFMPNDPENIRVSPVMTLVVNEINYQSNMAPDESIKALAYSITVTVTKVGELPL